MIKNFFAALKEYARSNSHIESVIIVGSYARGTNKKSSDLDIVIITSNKKEMITNQNFIQGFGDVSQKRTEYYGACTSVRVWYKNGQEIEFGFVEPSWIEKPLDNGTNKVLSDGYKIVLDKKRHFENLIL